MRCDHEIKFLADAELYLSRKNLAILARIGKTHEHRATCGDCSPASVLLLRCSGFFKNEGNKKPARGGLSAPVTAG